MSAHKIGCCCETCLIDQEARDVDDGDRAYDLAAELEREGGR